MTVETLLRTEWNEPEGIAPRGALVVVGGRAETDAVYQRFGRRIASDAYRVRFVDGDTRDLDALARRIDQALADPDVRTPAVLVGSDTGAAVVLDYVANRRDLTRPDAVVVAGLAYPDDDVVGGLDDQIAARTACPNHRGVLDRSGAQGALATSEVHVPRPRTGGIDVPLLVLHGSQDQVTPVDRARELLSGAAVRSEVVVIDDGLHDVLNDVTHRTVAATIIRFLERLKRDPSLRPIALEQTW